MPELPEVEAVARALNILLEGRSFVSAGLYREKLAPKIPASKFETVLANTGVKGVSRRGKYILIDFDNSHTLAVHLRMSGRFQIFQPFHENPKFTHAEFNLDDGSRLVFSDQRHFGYMNLFETDLVFSSKEMRDLAPEPFSEEFSVGYFRETLSSSGRKIKELLLDQKKVCGLGNIYASEALFLSRLHPEKPAKRISGVKANRLRDNIKSVLAASIEHSSGQKIDPLNLESRYFDGEFDGEWNVYDRESQPCRVCGKQIQRLMQAGRSSYFCPRCQRK